MGNDLMTRVDRILHDTFPGAETRLDVLNLNGKVSGFVIWDGFEGSEPLTRQRKVWAALRRALSPTQQSQVSATLTMSPEELLVMSEG